MIEKAAGVGKEEKEKEGNGGRKCTVDGELNWCSHYGRQYRGLSKN